jgi:hypothetical protein
VVPQGDDIRIHSPLLEEDLSRSFIILVVRTPVRGRCPLPATNQEPESVGLWFFIYPAYGGWSISNAEIGKVTKALPRIPERKSRAAAA